MKTPNTSFERILKEYAGEYYESPLAIHTNSSIPPITIQEKLEQLKGKTYSDIQSTDKHGQRLQWVNFVQEGGGTLGLALVGYAFVLEYVGLRFLRLAGTSAGAINTLFLAAIGKKDEPKTPEIYDMLQDPKRFDIRSFVDTKVPFLPPIIFFLAKGKGLENTLIYILAGILLTPLIINLISSLLHVPVSVILVLIFLIAAVCFFALYKMIFDKYGFGLNSGEVFRETLENEFANFGIHSSADMSKACKVTTIHNSKDDMDGIELQLVAHPFKNSIIERYNNFSHRLSETIKLDYSVVASDISNRYKVIFPAEADLYFDFPQDVNPAAFVRASMAVPAFFEPQYFPDKPRKSSLGKTISPTCKERWLTAKGLPIEQVASKGVLVDGGVLSNFPINIFHNQNIRNPRMPIMGARLIDSVMKPYDAADGLSIKTFVGKLVNTLRANEDNGFLASNPFYRRYCIADINLVPNKVNWLNFNLTEEEKHGLFRAGMLAAIAFLDQFDWEEYKVARINLHELLNHELTHMSGSDTNV